MQVRTRRFVALAGMTVLMLVATACGGDDDDGDAASPATEAETSETEAGDGEGYGRVVPPGESHIEEDEGEPVQGGTLVYGIEADSANPWAPFKTSTATSGYVMFASVSDPLFTATADGEIAPMLVESFEANEDFTEWTYQIREGITFHDGTPLDGAAVEFNYESCQYAPLTGAAYASVSSVESSGQTVTIKANGPAVVLPRLTTERQCAYMMSPTWLKTLPDIPQRNPELPIYDPEVAAIPATGDSAEPVGLGAFKFDSYTPGNGNGFRLVRNEDYWRGPNGITGEELPYLDAIEAVVAVDIDSRANGLRSGQYDLIHTANADKISEFLDDDDFEVTATSYYGDTGYIMFNVAEGPETDPEGTNADSPLLNVHCRRALAFATDRDRLIEERSAGLTMKATGPFGPGVLGHLEDSGYPDYDPDAAVEELDTCLEELGTDGIEFTFNTTNDPFNTESNTLILSMWQEVLGNQVQATIAPVEQGQYIGLALTGNFNAFAWSNHGGIDPDTQAYWWASGSAAPVGELALNFGRFKDADMDAALATLHTNSDPEVRKEAAEEINRIFGEQVYNLWLGWALWSVIQHPFVNGLESNTLIDGGEGIGMAFSGRHQMNQLWCDDGTCD